MRTLAEVRFCERFLLLKHSLDDVTLAQHESPANDRGWTIDTGENERLILTASTSMPDC